MKRPQDLSSQHKITRHSAVVYLTSTCRHSFQLEHSKHWTNPNRCCKEIIQTLIYFSEQQYKSWRWKGSKCTHFSPVKHIKCTYFSPVNHIKMHLLFTHQTHQMHLLFIRQTHQMHLLFISQTHQMHLLFTHQTHLLFTSQTHQMHLLFTSQTHQTHLLFNQSNTSNALTFSQSNTSHVPQAQWYGVSWSVVSVRISSYLVVLGFQCHRIQPGPARSVD